MFTVRTTKGINQVGCIIIAGQGFMAVKQTSSSGYALRLGLFTAIKYH